MHYLYPFYSFNTVAVEDFFPQRHSRYSEIKIVYRYGERFYSADAVDRVFENAAEELHAVQTRAVAGESAEEAAAAVVAVAVTAATEHAIDNDPNVTNSNSNKNSPRSVSSSASHTGASTTGGSACSGSRAIGKRNQQFYLPDGYVKLLHASIDPACGGDSSADGGASGASHTHKWHGRYDKSKNTITRTTAEYDAPDSVDIAEYETLSHFAQEHDKECWGNDYTPSNTHNVWKNPNFLYFNTVSLKWEPLNKLR
jgi:hypothetical protein